MASTFRGGFGYVVLRMQRELVNRRFAIPGRIARKQVYRGEHRRRVTQLLLRTSVSSAYILIVV